VFCPKCGRQVTENSKFCIYCGEPIEDPPAENTHVPSLSGTVGNGRIREAERVTNPSPAAGPENAQAGEQPSVSPFSPLSELEFASPKPEAPQGRKFNAWTVVVVVLAVLVVLWAIGSNYERSVVNQTPTEPAASSGTVEATWIDYASSDGSFAARFPSTPEYKSTSTTFAGVAAKYDMYTSNPGGDPPWYTIVVYKFQGTATVLSESDAATILGGAVGGMTGSGSWSSMSNSPVTTSNGYVTKDFTFKGIGDTSGLYMIGRASMKYSNRLYLALMTSEESNPATWGKFVQSFTLK
jgi:hypothetical protein